MNLLMAAVATPRPASPLTEPAPFETQVVWQSLIGLWHTLLGQLPYVLLGLTVLLVFLVAARLTQSVIYAVSRKAHLEDALAYLLSRLASAFVVIIGILAAAVVVFPTFEPGDLVAGLGITSVAIGFAFKDVLQNFFAGILILWRRPFRVGDQIRTRDHEGTVEDINIRATRLRTYEDERAIIPNADVYTNAVLVRTAFGARRIHFAVNVHYGEDIERVRSLIHGVLARIEGVVREPAPWVYLNEYAESSLQFDVFFWTEAHQANVLRVRDLVTTGIRQALNEAGIEIPYPHRVVILPQAQDGGNLTVDA